MILADEDGGRSVGIRPSAIEGDLVTVEATVVDGTRRWIITAPMLRLDEANDFAAWLAGLPGDLTLGAEEWTSLTFSKRTLSVSGRRIPGGMVELRLAVLGMRVTPGTATTDVVLGLRLPAADVQLAALDLSTELSRLGE